MLTALFKPLTADEIRQEINNRLRPERPKGRMTLAKEREYVQQLQQRRPELIKSPAKPEQVPEKTIEKTWVPPSPRYFRSERPTANGRREYIAPDARAVAEQQFGQVWRDPAEVMREKRAQLALHFAK